MTAKDLLVNLNVAAPVIDGKRTHMSPRLKYRMNMGGSTNLHDLTIIKVLEVVKEWKPFQHRPHFKWTVKVMGEIYPARQVVLRALDLTPAANINTYMAVSKLKQLGFDCFFEGNLN